MNSLDRICHVMFRRSSFTYCKTSCLPQTKWTIFYFDLSIYFNSLLCKHQKQLHLYEKKKRKWKEKKRRQTLWIWKMKRIKRNEPAWIQLKYTEEILRHSHCDILANSHCADFKFFWNSFDGTSLAFGILSRPYCILFVKNTIIIYIYLKKKNLKCKYFEIVLGFH